MNIEDSKKPIIGYIHPEEVNMSRHPQYMAYSVSKEQKNGEYISQKSFDPYSTFNTEITQKTHVTNICPLCEGKSLYSCSCPLQDMMCVKNHIWYVMKNGIIKIGDPHEGEN
jgi:hypothetical protein